MKFNHRGNGHNRVFVDPLQLVIMDGVGVVDLSELLKNHQSLLFTRQLIYANFMKIIHESLGCIFFL